MIDLSEKNCDRCNQPIQKGEGYAETDIGSGKWVHWPACPPSARFIPEKEEEKEERLPWPNMLPEAVVGVEELPTFSPALLGLVKKAWETKKWQRFWEWLIEPVTDGVLVGLRGEIRPHELFPVDVIQKIEVPETESGSPSSNPEKPLEEVFIVDGLTLKDYYDLRDLRLLLWGLEKELIGKHGIVEAEPLASKVRDLIKKKVEQVTGKIGSTPEHHSSPVSREEAEAEINVLIDNLAIAIRKGGDIPPDLREALRRNFMFFKSNPGFPPQYTDFENWLKKAQDMTMEQFIALPQERKTFIYGLFKSQWGNPHPSVSSGDSIQRPPF